MIRKSVILAFLLALAFNAGAQEISLIGMMKADVEEWMKNEHRDFSPDNSITKKQFNYLKYINGKQTITWLIYFSDDDRCTATKKVCDYSEYDRVVKDLNEQCEASGDLTWECTSGEQKFTISLSEEDWYFTLQERLIETER